MSAPVEEQELTISLAIKKVTDYLLKGNKVNDDTVLYSFFDVIKFNVHTIVCIENSGLVTYIEDVANNWKILDSSAVVFGLQVTAWLAENVVNYKHFKSSIHNVFSILCRDVQTKDSFDTSVLTALYESLSSLARQKGSVQWMLCDKHIADVTMKGLRLLEVSSSIFLEKAVIKYLTTVLLGVEELDKETDPSDSVTFSSRILNTTIQNVRKRYTKKHYGPFVPGSVQFLETLCRQSGVTGNCLLTQHFEFCEYLVELIGMIEVRDCNAVISIIDALLHTRINKEKSTENGKLLSGFIRRIEKQLADLACNGNIVIAQKLAVCCLEQGDESLTDTCVAILKDPVYWILDKLEKSSLFPEHILQTALSSKCRCTEIVCRSLDGQTIGASNTIITDVLRSTIVFSAHEDQPNSKAVGYLFKNRTVQRRCLEILIKVKPHENEDDTSLLPKAQVVTELFRESDSDTVIYSLCAQLLKEWLPSLFTNEKAVALTVTLAHVMQHHLSALQWELRDTTLELLGKIMANYKDHTSILQWLVEHRLHVQVWQCVMDGESYVRASAISAVYHLSVCPKLLSALIHSRIVSDENDIIQTVVDIITKDTEAFARRAAITYLFNIFKVKVSQNVKDSADIIPDVVIATIVTATKDFDWEVKLVALEFVSFILHEELSKYTKSGTDIQGLPEYARGLCNSRSGKESEVDIDLLMDRLCNKHLANVLLDALDDYDEKVCEKALSIFSELQSGLEALVENNTVIGTGKNCRYLSVLSQDRRSKDFTIVGEDGTKKRKLDNTCTIVTSKTMKHSDTSEETSLQLNKTSENSKKGLKDVRQSSICIGGSCAVNGKGDCKVESISAEYGDMLNRILNFDLSVYKVRLEKVHDSSAKLLSLVEDILTSENRTDEENAVDCY